MLFFTEFDYNWWAKNLLWIGLAHLVVLVLDIAFSIEYYTVIFNAYMTNFGETADAFFYILLNNGYMMFFDLLKTILIVALYPLIWDEVKRK